MIGQRSVEAHAVCAIEDEAPCERCHIIPTPGGRCACREEDDDA